MERSVAPQVKWIHNTIAIFWVIPNMFINTLFINEKLKLLIYGWGGVRLPMYWIISFNSTGGMTRDQKNHFDTWTPWRQDRDTPKNFDTCPDGCQGDSDQLQSFWRVLCAIYLL
jgi:hypothetical protein